MRKYRGREQTKTPVTNYRICKEKCWRISIKAKRILVFLCCKQNLVLERLAYSHWSLRFAYILCICWKATLSVTHIRQLVEDYGSKLEDSSFKYGGSRGLMDRALDLKPEVTGLNLGSGRKCPRLR